MKWFILNEVDGVVSRAESQKDAAEAIHECMSDNNGYEASDFVIICGEEYTYTPPTDTGTLRKVEK